MCVFGAREPPAPWVFCDLLFKVAGNLAIDRMRQQQSRARLDRISDIDDFLDNLPPERTVIAREELVYLGRVVGELPAKYQQAFRLHRLEDQRSTRSPGRWDSRSAWCAAT